MSRTTDRHSEPDYLIEVLAPSETIVTPFEKVIYYRIYRLRNKNTVLSPEESSKFYRTKQKIDALYPRLVAHSGRRPIELLSFLFTMRDSFDTIGASEAAAARVIVYYLEEESLDVYDEQLDLSVDDLREDGFGVIPAYTWAHLVDAANRRFLTDDVLHTAYNEATRGSQKDGEDGESFAIRLSKNSRLCRHVFCKTDVVNYYVQGLKTSVR